VDGEKARVLGFIAGLHSSDLLISDFKYMAEKALKTAKTGKITSETEWIPNFEITQKTVTPVQHDKLLYPGTTACPGLRYGAGGEKCCGSDGEKYCLS